MAHFDKAIPPGGEGKIKLTVRTKDYQGAVTKSARVYTNDPSKDVFILRIKAYVKVPIYISPRYVYLYGKEGETITKVIKVRGELDRALELTAGEFNLSKKVTYTVEKPEEDGVFLVRFVSIPGPPQSYHGFLKLMTNYPEKPEITIKIRGRINKKT